MLTCSIITCSLALQLLQICSLIPKPAHFVAAREDVISNIEENFETMNEACQLATTAIKIPTVVIEADPGFGKSQIARQFGEQYFKEQVGEAKPVVVFTLHAGNLQELGKSYLEFADLLSSDQESSAALRNIQFKSSTDQLKTLIPVVGDRLRATLKKYPELQWLVIVDNLFNLSHDREDMLNFLPHCNNPSMASWGSGRVLITMQLRGEFPETEMQRIITQDSLQLSQRKATTILWEVAKDDRQSEPEVVESIAQRLDCIPLALVSAATYKKLVMKKSLYTWSMYQEDLTTSVKVIRLPSSQYQQKCLPHAVLMTLNKLAEHSTVMKMAFVAVSYCEYRSIPGDLLYRFIRGQPECDLSGLDLRMAELRECPFLTCVDAPTSGEEGFVTLYNMHQITHSVLKNHAILEWGKNLKVPKAFLLSLLKTCLHHDEALNEGPIHSARRGFFSAHVFSIAQTASKVYKEAKMRKGQSECLWREIPEVMYVAVKNCILSPRAIHEQEQLLRECIGITDSSEMHTCVSREDHAKYLSELSVCLGNAGKESEAREKGLKALSILKEHNARPKLIASALQSVGWSFGTEIDLGIAIIKENLPFVKEAFGEDSKEYAISLFHLGEVQKKRDRNEARESFERAVFILKNKANDSLELAIAQSYYARFLLKGVSSSGMKLALELCEDNKRIVGKLVDRNAMIYIDMLLTWARACSSCFYPGRTLAEIPEHLETVRRYHQRPSAEWRLSLVLAVAHLMKGNLDECLPLMRTCIELQERKTLNFRVNIADSAGLKFAVLVLPVVNWVVVKPASALYSTATHLSALLRHYISFRN